MRILFLGINYWPEHTGIAPFSTGRCEFLAARGHEVTIVTAFPHYPRWRIAEEYRGRLFVREARNGVGIVRCPLYVPRRVTALGRILHEASFLAASLALALARSRPDVIFITSPPLGLALSGIMLSRRWRVPYVFHVEDIQPDAALELGMLSRSPLLAKTFYALVRAAYRHSALVSTLTEAMRQRIIAAGAAPDKVVLCPGWADPALFGIPVAVDGEGFRRAFELGDRFLAVHAGNMGVKQGLEVILGAAQRTINNPQIMYLLVGDGAMRPALESRARSLALPNLRILPLQPPEKVRELMAAADLGLLTQRKSVADILFPSKLLTLLASARPVVASIGTDSEVARMLVQSGAGLTVPVEDPRPLADAVAGLYRDAGRRRLMGERGRAYALANWNRDQILSLMETRLERLAGRQPRC